MAASIKHTFNAGFADGDNPAKLQPSHWNAEHTITGVVTSVNGNTPDANGNATVTTDHTQFTNIGTNTHAQIDTALTRLVNTSGTNTGDQDLTGLVHTNRAALDVVSGTNTGDETITTIKSKLGITTLSGSNTGDQDLTGLVHTNRAALDLVSGTNTGDQDLSGKQDVLVSGTNIKTVNSTSLLGSGNIPVAASVNGYTGTVVLASSDVGASPVAGPGSSQTFTVGNLTATTGNFSGDLRFTGTTGYLYTDSGSSLTGLSLSKANNIIQVYTANAERARFLATGNVLVGNNVAVSGAKLEVTGSISSTLAVTTTNTLFFTASNAFGVATVNGTGRIGAYSTAYGLTATGKGSTTDILLMNSSGNTALSVGTTAAANVMIGTTNDDGTNKLQVSGSLYVSGTSHHGSGAWPTTTFAQSNSAALIGNSASNLTSLIVANLTTNNGVGRGSSIFLGARGTDGSANICYVNVFGGKENATSGNFASYLNINTQNAAGAEVQGVRLTSAGRLGVGTAAPASSLHIKGAGTTSATEAFRVDNSSSGFALVVTDDYAVRSRTQAIGANYFGNAIPANGLIVEGNTLIGKNIDDGLAKLQTSNGITLGNSANANATVLDWYEEGTWTPTPTGLTVVGTPTYTGKFTRIGDMVYATINIVSTTSTASTAGTTMFSLPSGHSATTYSATVSAANNSTTIGMAGGLVANAVVYSPSWGASASITLSFSYKTS